MALFFLPIGLAFGFANAGIAFGWLGFAGAAHSVKIGVFAGSILSGIAGWIFLRRSAR